jgi:tetratricopeptide (TPR) repeat protein
MKTAYFLTALILVVLFNIQNVSAQDDAKIVAQAEEACSCSKKISVEIPRDSIVAKINYCITTSIINQMGDVMVGDVKKLVSQIEKGTIKDTTLIADKTYTIVVDKNFDEIQKYLFDNCTNVKNLLATNNALLDYSMSKNKKALTLYEEGVGYQQNETYDMAIVSYTRALKIDSKFSFAWDNLGLCYRKMGNYKEAIKSYQKSLELDPMGTTPLQNIAVTYEYLKDYKNASATYENFIALHPDNPEGYFGAGRMFYLMDSYAKGVDNMFKAYLLYTKTKSPYVNDATQNLQYYYSDLEKKGKLEIFKEAAKNNKIDIK